MTTKKPQRRRSFGDHLGSALIVVVTLPLLILDAAISNN